MTLPSKELLTEVLNVRPIVNVTLVHDDDYDIDVIHTDSGKENNYPYCLVEPTATPIHTLAHKCKEWAFNNNVEISSWKTIKQSKSEYGNSKWNNKMTSKIGWVASIGLNYTFAETEPEAIFKACQWVLDNKETK